ncbi:hypothetical protein KC19_10G138000 [Ceratodon purpureus]|uniref:Uncharacterized protein n=1 Tax=Ceratodon purpureus TaxID=3225 RepID=A0A8T0GK40_CERPU|nr:hypothetical protein KC19_10G138000 [Ceratodon purpureus]
MQSGKGDEYKYKCPKHTIVVVSDKFSSLLKVGSSRKPVASVLFFSFAGLEALKLLGSEFETATQDFSEDPCCSTFVNDDVVNDLSSLSSALLGLIVNPLLCLSASSPLRP